MFRGYVCVWGGDMGSEDPGRAWCNCSIKNGVMWGMGAGRREDRSDGPSHARLSLAVKMYDLYLAGTRNPSRAWSGCVMLRSRFPEDPLKDLETCPCPQ